MSEGQKERGVGRKVRGSKKTQSWHGKAKEEIVEKGRLIFRTFLNFPIILLIVSFLVLFPVLLCVVLVYQANGEKVAVLVVDTQGLFDNESSMLLTSCVFGLSTLMSSHQIYNVKERISEDHLQTLALFSE
jgi:hypothetical protein